MTRNAWLLAALLVTAGCVPRDGLMWQPVPDGQTATHLQHNNEASPRTVCVVFAPVAIGPLAKIHPDARGTWAFDLADRVSVLGKGADADGYASELLPGSEDPAWQKWPVAEAKGADYVVLTTILDIKTHEDPPTSSGTHVVSTAIAEMRVLDAHGNVVFNRKGRGDWDGYLNLKFSGPQSKAESQSSWLACSNAVGALLDWLGKRNQAVDSGPAPNAERMVAVEVASDPAGSDVLVDGVFRGNTPCTLQLPVHAVTVRIERRGFQAWERKLVPDTGMKVRPALDPAAP